MTGSIVRTLVLLCALLVQCGCAAKSYILTSQESLNEGQFSPSKIYGRSELLGGWRNPMRVSGVEMYTHLHNSKTVREADISFIVPIPLKIPEGTGIGEIGRRPFKIFLVMNADGEGATVNPLASRLYLGSSSEAIEPDKVIRATHPEYALSSNPPSRFSAEVTEDKIPLFNKQTIMDPEGREIQDWTIPHDTYLQFYFDIPTPDPSEEFQLKLGEIITPSGEAIRPTIYFSPVNVVEIVH